MNQQRRGALRESLLAQGFERDFYTNDLDGTGDYTETWTNGVTTINIAWGPRQ